MCSIVVLRQSDSEWPIIIGANRDEMIERKSLPPDRHWSEQNHIIGGKDIEAGGTWLAVNDYGLVAKKEFYDIEKNKKIKFSENVSASPTEEEDFIYSFLSSLRQKINNPTNKKIVPRN